jgi:nucleoside-diphosphate-sugar epimerase
MILVTGANGFVGRALVDELESRCMPVRGAIRHSNTRNQFHQSICVGEVGENTNWFHALQGVGVVIHCAARAHVMNEAPADAIAAYRSVNVEGTRRLAEQASDAGVKRFIYLSSIKVNGERTMLGRPFQPSDSPAPEDAYGQSKWEAEQALAEITSRTGIELVIVRPPLVYGPGVKGNLARLLMLASRGVPLPLGSVDNRRSLIGLDNLVDLLIRCIDHPRVVGHTLLVSDGHDLSTADLLQLMAQGLGQRAHLFPFPQSVLRLAGRFLGRVGEVERLIGSLQIDSSESRALLGWTPPLSVEEGLKKMVVAL